MDSLHWRNLNKQVKFERTKKQYYRRFLWRLVYSIDHVCLASDKHVHDVINYVREKRRIERDRANAPGRSTYYYTGYYRQDEWEKCDEQLIDRVRTVMNTFKDLVKFRAEWGTLQIYAETEEDLKRVAAAISHDEDITIVTGPYPGTEDRLRAGHVFMNKIDYKFKITLRDGNYDANTKQSILNQLSQRDDVKIPPQLHRELNKKYPALWGAYLYTNDDSIVTILSLISPGIVGNIHPIDHLL